jgi:hypothetical protein
MFLRKAAKHKKWKKQDFFLKTYRIFHFFISLLNNKTKIVKAFLFRIKN